MSPNLDTYIGQAIEVEDRENLDQCFDWAFLVCDLIGIPRAAIRTLFAKDIWTTYDPAYFDKVTTPQFLDLAIWGTRVGPAGHVAVVKRPTALGFQSYDQNWEGIQKVQLVDHNSFGLLGFLRPKIKQGGSSMGTVTLEQAVYDDLAWWKKQATENYIVPAAELQDYKAWKNQGMQQAEELKQAKLTIESLQKAATELAPGLYKVK